MATTRRGDVQDVNITSSFKGPPGTLEHDPSDQGTHNPTPDDHEPTALSTTTSSSSSSSIGALSEEYEHVLTRHLMMSQQTNVSLQHHVNPDRPEISMQIQNVELALKDLSEGNVATEITTHLSELVPKIIRLERNAKTQTTLRGIFEEENQKLKTEAEQMRQDIDDIKEENKKLQEEVGELKRSKEDEQLGGFDYVTKKEASEIKDAEKKEAEKQQTAVPPTGISEENYFILQRKYISLKKQIEEIVKVNHSWDEHYRTMKSQLESRMDNLQKELGGAKQQAMTLQKEQKVGGDMLVLEMARIEKAEKERAGALAEVVAVNQKCEKLERYARTLTGQRNEMEKEIKRLNEALALKMRTNAAQSSAAAGIQAELPGEPQPQSIVEVGQRDDQSSLSNQKLKGVHEMTESEMKEEIELLRQQTDVFQSDFTHERRDRQRIMGELDVVQKDLRRTKKLLKQRDREVVYQDPELTHQLQRDLRRDRQYSTSAPTRDYGYVVYPRPPARYNQPTYQRETGRLIAHGKGRQAYNLAGNDMYIDGDLEIDGEQGIGTRDQAPTDTNSNTDHQNGTQNNRICPRCERTFENDPDYHVHINACLDN